MLRWILGVAFVAIVALLIVIVISLMAPIAPFLMGDRDEAERALTSLAVRSFFCLAAITMMLAIFLKRFRPRQAGTHQDQQTPILGIASGQSGLERRVAEIHEWR